MYGTIKKEPVPSTSVSERTWDPAMSKCTPCLTQVRKPATLKSFKLCLKCNKYFFELCDFIRFYYARSD